MSDTIPATTPVGIYTHRMSTIYSIRNDWICTTRTNKIIQTH